MPLRAGSELGPYRLLGALGAGGMGEVYRARDTRLGREVAVKVLPAEHLKDDVRRRRFVQEARAASALNHPHIVTIHEIESADGIDFIVMEYVPGQTLDTLIPKTGMPVREALRLAIPIADALSAAHARGIVHRDVKPANVIVSDEGVVKVLDFGLAKRVADDGDEPAETQATLTSPEPLSQPGAIPGTAAYMSPEQTTGGRVDARSDIFAFGVVLYEMLTGCRPFLGTSVSEVRTAVVRDEPRPPRELAPGTPEALERITLRCLRKDPQRRIQHIGDVKLELEELVQEVERGTPRAAEPPPRVESLGATRRSPPHARRRWLRLAAVVAVAGLVAPLVMLARLREPPPRAREPEIVPFTSLPGLEAVPTFSPDGSQIAFTWNGDGQEGYDLYVKVIGSERLLRLTHEPATWISTAWSPDGRVIAFRRVAKRGREHSGVFLIPALGGQERRLSDAGNVNPLRFLSWSPDGTLLAHAIANSVELLNVATLESRSLPPPAAECGSTMGAAFSPDGLSLASVCLVSQGRFAIFVGPVSGKGARKLAMVHGGIHRLGYAPDGRHLVYDNRGSVWRLPVTGGAPEALLADRDATSPVLARGGGRLAYVQAVSNDNLWRVRLSERSRAAAPPESFLSSSRRSHSYPAFSRDARRIAFGSDRSGTGEIWVCNADGSDPVQLTSFRGPETGTPVWSFDGSEVVFDSRPDGDAQLFAVRADGGVPRPIDTGIPNSSQPSFSGDGRWLYFVGGHESAIQIYKMRYPGGPTVAITTQGGVWPRESADGQRVFYARSGALWSASIAGGDERAEARFPAGSSWGWVPAPGGLYLIDRSGPQAALAFFDLATRRVHRIVEVPRASLWQAIAISPDGRSILYSQRDTDIADIMLVEGID